MHTRTSDTATGDGPTAPEPYRRLEDGTLGWTHPDTGLEVGLVRERRPSTGRMTAATATAGDDVCWVFEVRPNEYAEIYRRLAGDRDAAVAHACEWMADHPEGRLGD